MADMPKVVYPSQALLSAEGGHRGEGEGLGGEREEGRGQGPLMMESQGSGRRATLWLSLYVIIVTASLTWRCRVGQKCTSTYTGCSLCSPGKLNPKRRKPHFLFSKSFFVTELEKKKKFRKNPMRENKGTNRLVCDAMLKMAEIHLTHKSTDSDLAHLLD